MKTLLLFALNKIVYRSLKVIFQLHKYVEIIFNISLV